MSAALNVFDRTAPGLAPIGASVTNQEISQEFSLTGYGILHLRIDVEASAASGTVTAKLQTRSPGGSYTDLSGANASVSITAAGTFSITQLVERAADQPNMPLQKAARVVVTTAAASSVTISKVWVQQGY